MRYRKDYDPFDLLVLLARLAARGLALGGLAFAAVSIVSELGPPTREPPLATMIGPTGTEIGPSAAPAS